MRVERIMKNGCRCMIFSIFALILFTIWNNYKQKKLLHTVENIKEKNKLRQFDPNPTQDHLELNDLGNSAVNKYLYDHYVENIELVQQERKMVLSEACHKYPELSKFRNTRGLFHIIADTNHQVMFAFCPKVASSTWLRMMVQISGKYNGQVPLQKITLDYHNLEKYGLVYMSRLDPKEGLRRLETYKKVMFSRNPFERILSAYKDKISPAKGKELYQRMFGKDIMRRKRPNATAEELKTGYGVTFSEFISWLVDIENVLALDPHFRPLYMLSRPCVLKYDFLGRFETLHEDIEYVLRNVFNLNSTEHLPFHKMSKETNTSVIAKYYRDIPSSHVEKLREMYKQDFHLFGYSTKIPGL